MKSNVTTREVLRAKHPVKHLIVNLIFDYFIDYLEGDIRGVYRIKNLRDPETNAFLYGLLFRKTIYLRHELNKTQLLQTLIHELAHHHFHKAFESTIRKIENLLWRWFTTTQKAVLATYIPKRAAKIKVTYKCARTRD